jgi:hypothetical protein
MATGPRDPVAAAATGRGRIRASDADREQVIDALKTAFVHGRLTKDELSVRTGRALGSRTYAELTAIIADLVPRPARLRSPRLPAQSARPAPRPAAPAQPGTRTPASRKPLVWAAGAVVLTPALGAAFLTFYGGFLVLLVFAFIGVVVTAQPRAPS